MCVKPHECTPSIVLKCTCRRLNVKSFNVSYTGQFSKLNKLIRVNAYCERFINNCKLSKANWQTTILTTQDLDQALTCWVKMVQQISYSQEFKDLMEQQDVAATSSLKTVHPFTEQEGLLRVGWIQQSTLPYQAIHQMILPASQHFTKLIVSAEHIWFYHVGPQLDSLITCKVLDTKNQELGENSNSSQPNLL
jgi:hypothetical protein